MKAKLFAFIEPPQQTFLKYDVKDVSYPARYARAIAYYRETEPDMAIQAIDNLLHDYPDNPYLWELKGQVLFEAGRTKDSRGAPSPLRRAETRCTAPYASTSPARSLRRRMVSAPDEAIDQLNKALALDHDNAFAWALMAQADDTKGDGGGARLASAEERFALGDMVQARVFALRARELLTRGTPEWRRATDIVLVSNPSKNDLKALQGQGG